MNFEPNKLTRILAASALGLSMVMAGCAGTTAVTEENAPSDLLKKAAAITSESDPEDVQEVFQGFVDATQKASDNRLVIAETATGTGLKLDSDDLETTENSFKNYDVRYGADDSFFQLYEEEGQNDSVYGLMDSSDKTITTVYMTPEDKETAFAKEDAAMTIDTIDTRESGLSDATPEQLQNSIDNAIVYPLYTLLGSSLVIQPMASPESYTFKLEKTGDVYTWTISIADQEKYNKSLDDIFEQSYGHDRKDIRGDGTFILDSYDITGVSMVLTMDENGALSKIESSNQSTVKKGDESKDLSSSDVVTIEQAPETWKPFFEGFFKEISDKSLKEKDTFALMQSFTDEDSQSSEASKESSEKQSSEKKSSEDSRSESAGKDSEKQSSESKSSAASSEKKDSSASSSEKSSASASSAAADESTSRK